MGAFYSIQTFDDFDDFAESVTWELEFHQLSLGKFQANLTFIGDLDIQVGETLYNRALLQKGSVPSGFTFAVHHPDSAPFTWRYLEFPPNGIIVFPDNNEHQGVSQPNHHPFTVTISETFLSTVALEIGLPNVDQFVIKGEVLLCAPAAIQRIQTFLKTLCATMKYKNGGFVDTLLSHETKWKIARLFLLALASSKQYRPRKRQFSRRKKIADRVLQYVDADLTKNRSLPELCKVAEVDERTLRNIFYEQFYLSPKKYINCHRLNVVRSALKRTDSPTISIADIANESGFWHMGQFALGYKRLFGELPSQTLKRKSNGQRNLNQ